jgi:radical S-adenosyl methionine domain-containing protein 2
MILPAVNFHVTRACNARCSFCFATFRDVPGQLRPTDARRLVRALADAGVEKLNFAGGEPTLHRGIGTLLHDSRTHGLVTSIVSNGARMAALLDHHAADLDWVGLSVDSAHEATEVALGRSRGRHVADSLALAARCRALGIRVKLNSVVSALNADEDMSGFVRVMAPERWKVFQVLPMKGQNDGSVEPLLISADRFAAFVERHRPLVAEGLGPIVEDNDAMLGSYAMIDPEGRFFGNVTGEHVYSRPILEVGVEAALSEVGVSASKFALRGGVYAWNR